MELAIINFGPWEIAGIVAIGVLLFGSRLPSIARSLGKSVTEFRKGVKDLKTEVDSDDEPRKIEDKREVKAEKVEKAETEAEKVS
ncbi:MAG: twin-arginine translocase TatA/TatE family subunit [Planctomycetes bacterium]|nr:twin-arginine translocase TatA/TatE family subunit [Planctomycetota bacterium]